MLIKALGSLTRWSLFRRARPPKRAWDVVAWWESRRIPYNLIVGAAGIASAIVMLLTGYVTEHVIGEAVGVPSSPFFAMVVVVVYGLMANVCFTGGWILELLSGRIWGTRAEAFGEIAFTWGLLCSVLFTLLPAALRQIRYDTKPSKKRALIGIEARTLKSRAKGLALKVHWRKG